MRYQKITLTAIFLVAFIITLPITGVFSQEVTVGKEVVAQSQSLLEKFITSAITKMNFRDFGFKDFQEVKGARLGDPLPIKFICLKELKLYRAETTVRTLMKDSKKLWFPVIVTGEARNQFVVSEKNGKLVASQFGKSRTAQTIFLARTRIPVALEAKHIKVDYKTFLLEIPALMATFIDVECSEGDFLVPAMAEPARYNLENGKMYLANEVLSKLSEYAKQIDEERIR